MREFLKMVCVLTIMACGFGAAIAWFVPEKITMLVWTLRVALTAGCIAAFIGFLMIHFRRDVAPDYLFTYVGKYFDRGGFCFLPQIWLSDGVCYLRVPFQNQYEMPCIGRVAIRPARGFFAKRDWDAITVEVKADAAAFGIAKVPIPVPIPYQGTRQRFEIGASVSYPEGKGRQLRFRDGMVLRTSSEFGNSFRTALTVAGALGGSIVLSSPASITVAFPANVAEEFSTQPTPVIEILWKLGDPPLTTTE